MANCGVIVQARMSSTRLPGKVLIKIFEDLSMLDLICQRLKKSKKTDIFIIATSCEDSDDPIEQFCLINNIHCFRGSLDNVLERYYQCCQQYQLDHIARITGDCPLIDPQLLDDMWTAYLSKNKIDYYSNVLERTYPRGYDIELFPRATLELLYQQVVDASEKEHVTMHINKNRDQFVIAHHLNEINLSNYRLTVDTPEDLKLIQNIYKLVNKPIFGLEQTIEILETHSELSQINQHIQQKLS